MAEAKRKFSWKSLGVAVAIVAAVILIVVGIVMSQRVEPIPDGYFVSDDSKLVLTLGSDMVSLTDADAEPGLTHLVYYYSGDDVTDAKIYFEYEDDASAKEANEKIKISETSWAKSKKLNGRYIVFQLTEDQYEGLSADGVRESIEAMKAAGAAE